MAFGLPSYGHIAQILAVLAKEQTRQAKGLTLKLTPNLRIG